MTKQKNETTTELKTTVADKISTAGQRAVHFRTLAILGIAAACGLSVPPPRLWSSLHALRFASCNSCPQINAETFMGETASSNRLLP